MGLPLFGHEQVDRYRDTDGEDGHDDPSVAVQVKADHHTARAGVAMDEKKPELWRTMTATGTPYDKFQVKADREIPFVTRRGSRARLQKQGRSTEGEQRSAPRQKQGVEPAVGCVLPWIGLGTPLDRPSRAAAPSAPSVELRALAG